MRSIRGINITNYHRSTIALLSLVSFSPLSIFDTRRRCRRYLTPRIEYRQFGPLNCLALTYIFGVTQYYAIPRDELVADNTVVIRTSSLDSSSRIRKRHCVSQSCRVDSGWWEVRVRGAQTAAAPRTSFVFRSFSAERRRTNKSWDPAWNCVGRLLLLPPRHTVLSHRAQAPTETGRRVGTDGHSTDVQSDFKEYAHREARLVVDK